MSSYGRNFHFRNPPNGNERHGRFATQDELPIGVPVKIDTAAGTDALGLQKVELATGAQAPDSGCGILVYEYGPAAFAGDDPNLVLYSDKDTAPSGAAVQVVHGTHIKVALANTDNEPYTHFTAGWESGPRMMVAGIGATPTVTVGDYLTPGTGNDNAGYWAETSDASKGWLRVTKVDLARSEVEAELLF